ncbi:hypothetical protein D047_0070 [Vibrio parahaemolyticus VPTS-2010_2]|nr:hypothetical protein D047_0070 [Vibrio parahaemolyticus VPTS-2010_2]
MQFTFTQFFVEPFIAQYGDGNQKCQSLCGQVQREIVLLNPANQLIDWLLCSIESHLTHCYSCLSFFLAHT